MKDQINNYIIKSKLIYIDVISLKISYDQIKNYYEQLIKINKFFITDLNEIKELAKIRPIISSNVNSSYYHLVVLYRNNSNKVLIFFHDIKNGNFLYNTMDIIDIKLNFDRFNKNCRGKSHIYQILIY